MYWFEEEDLERFWRTRTSFDAIDADSGTFILDKAHDKSIPSIIPVEWKKSKLGKALCSLFQIPEVDAREQLINGADKILKNKNKTNSDSNLVDVQGQRQIDNELSMKTLENKMDVFELSMKTLENKMDVILQKLD